LLIADQNSPVQHFLLGRGKYLRLGNDASIYMLYDKSKEITYMLLHRQRKVSEVNMEFENFKATNTPDACSEFVMNTKSMPDILERVTGVNIGDCYREIRFYYNPDYDVPGSMANMDNVGDLAFIRISPSFLVYDNKCARKYEVHELQHAMRYCANTSSNDEGGPHIFSDATQAELMKEFGDALGANGFIYPLSKWVDNITKDPSPVMNASMSVRCTALKTFYLSKKYLSLSDDGRRDLVREFHTALMNDSRMLAESTETEAINEIACNLSKDPNCATMLKNNCSK
jgi:hypothetical protein